MASSIRWPVLDDDTLRRFVIQTFGHARRTQDSPIAPDVWIALIRRAERVAKARHADQKLPDDKVDILITPWRGASPGEIAAYLRDAPRDREDTDVEMVALNSGFIVAAVDLGTMVQIVIPMTDWWQGLSDRFWTNLTDYKSYSDLERSGDSLSRILSKCRNDGIQYFRLAAVAGFAQAMKGANASEAKKLIAIIRKFAALSRNGGGGEFENLGQDQFDFASRRIEPTAEDLMSLIWPFEYAFAAPLGGYARRRQGGDPETPLSSPASDTISDRKTRKVLREPHVYAVNLNRPAAPMLFDSRRTVKADAAQRLFEIDTSTMTYAVIDGGIDALHPAFLNWADPTLDKSIADAKAHDELEGFVVTIDQTCGPREKLERLKRSRIIKTYDFTRLRLIQNAAYSRDNASLPPEVGAILNNPAFADNVAHLRMRGDFARDLDWTIIEPLIEIPHDNADAYKVPMSSHGTHVAGILAANLEKPEDIRQPLIGMCPDLKILDLRVFDDHGRSEEFTILSAVEFIGWLNRNRDYPVVHGANLSLALRHYVDSYACGRTPICEACNRLADSGTVVVVAAGNTGFDAEAKQQSMGRGYRQITITDPGNADGVITVGSTHRRDPHAYGVSYFSSRGPTGDGRRKPDLVAPGEKITSSVPGGKTESMDGTSMAAPHVSGAAVLLMARNPELIGRPARIKEILMRTATDLGRERDFQGAGLVDILRALQSI
ncbi:MAG: serine protease [Mesorhizobium sp.]|uniref:S8 family peptidase n=1 Tax=Mesorhizobium sp. TaxID=1871066 RepID=UPI00121C0D2C|nr:S8 family peptidase [Mesorhizobium sp.]TIR17102.1 MAG: serine protease [Mesorhizobium sp.]